MFQIIRWSLISELQSKRELMAGHPTAAAVRGCNRKGTIFCRFGKISLFQIIRYWYIKDISDISEIHKSTFGWTVDNVHWTSSTAAVRSDCKRTAGPSPSLVALLQIFCKTFLFQIIGWYFISFCYIWALSWTVDIQSQLLLLQFVCRTSQVPRPSCEPSEFWNPDQVRSCH